MKQHLWKVSILTDDKLLACQRLFALRTDSVEICPPSQAGFRLVEPYSSERGLTFGALTDQQSNCLRQLISPWIAKGLTRYFTSCLVRKRAILASVAKPVMKMKRSARDGRISFAFR